MSGRASSRVRFKSRRPCRLPEESCHDAGAHLCRSGRRARCAACVACRYVRARRGLAPPIVLVLLLFVLAVGSDAAASRSASFGSPARFSRSCSRWRCSGRRRLRRSASACSARRRARLAATRSTRRSTTSRRTPPSRSSAALAMHASLGDCDPATSDPLVRRPRPRRLPGHERAELRRSSRPTCGSVRASRSGRAPRLFRHRPPVEFATGLLTAGVAFGYGRIGVGAVGLAAVVLFVFQYLLRAGVQAVRARRGTVPAHTRARVAPGGPAQHGDADAVHARRDDRSALGRRRALRPRGRARCSVSPSASRS